MMEHILAAFVFVFVGFMINPVFGILCLVASPAFIIVGGVEEHKKKTEAAREQRKRNIFRKLGELRASAGLTREELSEKTGISVWELKQYEDFPGCTIGWHRPETIAALGEALGFDPHEWRLYNSGH